MNTKNSSGLHFVFIAVLIIGLCQACYVKRSVSIEQVKLMLYKKVLLDYSGQKYELKNIVINDSIIIGDIQTYQIHKPQQNYLNIYLNSFKDINDIHENHVKIPLSSINRFEVYDIHVGRTISVSTATTIAAAIIINEMIKESTSRSSSHRSTSSTQSSPSTTDSSCPFVYVGYEHGYEFVGEVYAGASAQYYERHDYLKLPDVEIQSGICNVLFDNPLNEDQHTNLIELIAVEHESDVEVAYDKYGVLHTITKPAAPVRAVNENGLSILKELKDSDSLTYWGGDEQETNLKDELYFSFKNEKQNSRAKIIIDGKNTLWLDKLYNQFVKLSGRKYEDYKKRVSYLPEEEIKQLRLKNGVSLAFYLKVNHQWQFIDDFELVGPLSNKRQIIEFDISAVDGEFIEVKLLAGKYFWSIDQVAMDFEPDKSIDIHSCMIQSHKTAYSHEIIDYIIRDDDQYFNQCRIGDQINISFKVPQANNGLKQSLILHTKGYYDIKSDSDERPQRALLRKFRQPGYFMVFSQDMLKEQMKDMTN